MSQPAANPTGQSDAEIAASIRAHILPTSKRLRNYPEQFVELQTIRQEIITPFLQALGYNFESFAAVVSDFPPDPEFRKRKVDFAMMEHGAESLLVNCTSPQTPFRPVEARQIVWFLEHSRADVGIITNGFEFRCFSTWGEPRNEPFFEFRLDYTSSRIYEELAPLSKPLIQSEQTRAFVEKKRRTRLVQQALIEEYNMPSADFAQVLLERAGLSHEEDPEIVRDAFFWLVNNSLNTALLSHRQRTNPSSVAPSKNGDSAAPAENQDSDDESGDGQVRVAS